MAVAPIGTYFGSLKYIWNGESAKVKYAYPDSFTASDPRHSDFLDETGAC